jgi:hypothetical protein
MDFVDADIKHSPASLLFYIFSTTLLINSVSVIQQIINLKCQGTEGYFPLTALHFGYVEGRIVSVVSIRLVLGIHSGKISRHGF